MLGPLDLELEAVVSHSVWVLGAKFSLTAQLWLA